MRPITLIINKSNMWDMIRVIRELDRTKTRFEVDLYSADRKTQLIVGSFLMHLLDKHIKQLTA